MYHFKGGAKRKEASVTLADLYGKFGPMLGTLTPTAVTASTEP